jgi:hypothetical protein
VEQFECLLTGFNGCTVFLLPEQGMSEMSLGIDAERWAKAHGAEFVIHIGGKS